MDRIYMDNAATTRVKDEVLSEMLPYFTEVYGNASSVHAFGREAKKAIEKAREQVAQAINADKNEIFFTNGGTEADNWIVKGIAQAARKKGNHIITSAIEHHALLHTCQALEREGFRVTYLPVDADGLVSPEALEAALTPDTILVSILFANNEIGTIQPVAQLAEIAHAHGVPFHTDAVQAVGSVPIDVKAMGIDALSMAAHKFYGPKGVGALYIRKGLKVETFQQGGAQERGRRGGTENVPGIVGMGKAIELATANLDAHAARLIEMRDRLIDGILDRIPETRLNGHRTQRLPGNVNVSVRYIEGEALLLSLDLAGIAASSGSACTSGSLDPSHVLLGIGLPHEIAHGSLRLSLGDFNTDEEIDVVLKKLPEIVTRLRNMSPLFNQFKGGEVLV
ncbi:MAG: cysteine desulfurase NifS [Oscillospiraceae bacterium]|jgi:cysteine desulfurase|nr:cysteine desulfurase NifS [Oscillospiraceae bacterium]